MSKVPLPGAPAHSGDPKVAPLTHHQTTTTGQPGRDALAVAPPPLQGAR
jgi:hypothetical protein